MTSPLFARIALVYLLPLLYMQYLAAELYFLGNENILGFLTVTVIFSFNFCMVDSFFPFSYHNPTQSDLFKQGRDTLVGIVNGGLYCWKGHPDWYTRISFHR